MGAFYETIPASLIKWILAQKVFWVASAPLSGDGHVNVSPKGGQYFGVIDERTFWYMDLTGSGNETISHLHEPGNSRITIQFNAFDGPPKIVRLWGKGRALENGTDAYDDFIATHKVQTLPGSRTIVIVDVHQVGSSCGFSVPFYDFREFRPVLNNFFEKKKEKFDAGHHEESMDRYWAYKNAWSMDGLPGMRRALVAAKEEGVAPIKKMVGPWAPKRYQDGRGFSVEQVLMIALMSFMLGMALVVYGPLVCEHLPAQALDMTAVRSMLTQGRS
ncbi:hypothetical protein LTR53_001365 [Teratosphaeriaceae sp. CCFEE 6253]|nr:hypothetical protein LTR53_001365 [Teratosphaeriaceae sp. CCFEE 6253]